MKDFLLNNGDIIIAGLGIFTLFYVMNQSLEDLDRALIKQQLVYNQCAAKCTDLNKAPKLYGDSCLCIEPQ